MIDGPLDVHVRTEQPSGDRVVELRKMGCRITLWRCPSDTEAVAYQYAKDVAHFLGIPLTVE